MKFILRQTSQYNLLTGDIVGRLSAHPVYKHSWDPDKGEHYITINTVEDLVRLTKIFEEELIITFNRLNDKPIIEIYDDWRE